MAISTEKELAASERFMLIKITPARFYADTEWTSVGSSRYTLTFAFQNLSAIKRNGAALTKVTSFTGNDQYSFNESTKLVTVQLAAGPDDDTNVLVLFYDLFFTGNQARYYPENPESAESASNPLVCWEPRIIKYPSISQTIRNIKEGILTIENTSLSILNTDNELQNYITDKDSFKNKNVIIWQCINDVSSIAKVYKGQVDEISSITSSQLDITVFDPFTKLSQNSYMGDSFFESVAYISSGGYPNLYPNDNGKPIRFSFGPTPWRSSGYQSATTPSVNYINTGLRAYCTDYTPNGTTSDNRSYVLGRTRKQARMQNFGTFVRGTSVGVNTHIMLTGHNLEIGDTIDDSAGTGIYGTVSKNENYTFLGFAYNVMITNPIGGVGTNISLWQKQKQVAIFFNDNADFAGSFAPPQGDEYSLIETVTSGGNYLYEITFNNNAEVGGSWGNWFGGAAFTPDKGPELYYRIITEDDTHASGLKKMLDGIGIDTKDSTFTAADSSLSANLKMVIPEIDTDEYSTVADEVQKILKSTLSYLKINSDLEAEYHLLTAPSTTTETNDDFIIKGSYSQSISYSDIKTSIIFQNKLSIGEWAEPTLTTQVANIQTTNTIAKYLHELDSTLIFNHVLEDITGRSEAIQAVLSSPNKKHSFETATEHIDSEIGDDITLLVDTLPVGVSSENIKIISIKKNSAKVSIVCDEIEGL